MNLFLLIEQIKETRKDVAEGNQQGASLTRSLS